MGHGSMDAARYKQLQTLFLGAAERPRAEQQEYLRAVCADEDIVAEARAYDDSAASSAGPSPSA